ncbi:DNA polymerase III subunit delta' [Candidatus Halobeggiatoa sp. HSG11]|nr:DNA polymerase III subunit delta' [Candidatus Halobeggiatoa sp. HSG11]
MNNILPWHESLWQQTLSRNLPHALLLSGPQGMGKGLFARNLAETLLCEQKQACGDCKPCYLLKANTHPDLLLVQPADIGKQIAVDQIRSMIKFCALTAKYESYQIVIIEPAEAMNRNAANSLLKLLEEPPAYTLIMLVSNNPMVLAATIRSRCQKLDFSWPDKNLTHNWLNEQLSNKNHTDLLLNLSSQAPLAAKDLADSMSKRQELFDSLMTLSTNDPVKIAANWAKMEVVSVLKWLLSWTADVIRYSATGQTQHLVNQDQLGSLQNFANHLNLQRLFKVLDLQQEAYQLLTGNTNIKPQGLLETIAIAWVDLKRRI